MLREEAEGSASGHTAWCALGVLHVRPVRTYWSEQAPRKSDWRSARASEVPCGGVLAGALRGGRGWEEGPGAGEVRECLCPGAAGGAGCLRGAWTEESESEGPMCDALRMDGECAAVACHLSASWERSSLGLREGAVDPERGGGR